MESRSWIASQSPEAFPNASRSFSACAVLAEKVVSWKFLHLSIRFVLRCQFLDPPIDDSFTFSVGNFLTQLSMTLLL